MQATSRWSAVWTPEEIEAINASFDDTYHHVKMDLPTCRRNLLAMKDLFDQMGLPFFLLFGTLLGAHRDKDFIPGDHDTDVGILVADADKLAELFRLGFFLAFNEWKVIRVWDGLISIARDGEYIDIYIFEDSPDPDKWCSCGTYYLEKKYLEPPGTIELWGQVYQTVNAVEKYLSDRYGDWRTPANVQATH